MLAVSFAVKGSGRRVHSQKLVRADPTMSVSPSSGQHETALHLLVFLEIQLHPSDQLRASAADLQGRHIKTGLYQTRSKWPTRKVCRRSAA